MTVQVMISKVDFTFVYCYKDYALVKFLFKILFLAHLFCVYSVTLN